MKMMKYQYSEGKIEIEDIQKVLPGFNGHLMRGHTYKLRKHVMQDFVLARHYEEANINYEEGI